MRRFVLGAVLAGGAAAQVPAGLAAAHDPAAAAPVVQAATLAGRKVLTLQGAKQVAAAAIAEARRLRAPGAAVAVTDEGGNLLYLERLDGTFAMAAAVSTGKARTAALFQKPTKAFEDLINKGRTAMAALPDFTPLQGGVPVLVDGVVAGAVGVSGAASAQQDDEIANVAAATKLGERAVSCCEGVEPGPVTHIASADVAAAFAVGRPLLEVPDYKIHASLRRAPGLAEVHDDETDVIYVLGGTATLVTGGSVVEPQPIAPHEVRGKSIAGGSVHQLAPGDVLVVPQGTPHWFQQVAAPFTYYVVKVVHGSHGA
ncbi:MAG TPA: heme-binding protein [Planctomycetota bacterium]|nr:heme-binding protein [Planctomycetota bacterium]